MSKREGTVVVDLYEETLLSGSSYTFRSHEAARRMACRVTTNPDVKELFFLDGLRFLACGDDYITQCGQRGTHYYGRGGRYINYVIRRDA